MQNSECSMTPCLLKNLLFHSAETSYTVHSLVGSMMHSTAYCCNPVRMTSSPSQLIPVAFSTKADRCNELCPFSWKLLMSSGL